jgi:hypothetical protein
MSKELLPKLKSISPGMLTQEEHEWLADEAITLDKVRGIMKSTNLCEHEKFNLLHDIFSKESGDEKWTSHSEESSGIDGCFRS